MDIVEYIKDLQNELKKAGYAEKLISYEELQMLHKTYASDMEEKHFAQEVLKLSYSSYMNLKNNNGRAKILKVLFNISDNKKKESEAIIDNIKVDSIKRALIEQGYKGKSIGHEEFEDLYRIYGTTMQQKFFAQKILGLSYDSYMRIKHNKGRGKILKENDLGENEEKIEYIKQELIRMGYAGKFKNYHELQDLYKRYGNGINEKKFIEEVLEVSYCCYAGTRTRGRRTKILKSQVNKITEEEINNIKQELVSLGYIAKSLDYGEIKSIYNVYGQDLEERYFAQNILEISAQNYWRIKGKGERVKILKRQRNLITKEEIEDIKNKLEKDGYGKKLISYKELQELFKKYGKCMIEQDFAQNVLELSYANYNNVKNKEKTVKILCSKKEIVLLENMLLKESRYYTKEEIDEICTDNNISMDKFVQQVLSKNINKYKSEYMDLLKKQGKVWIGKTKMSEDFVVEKFNTMMILAKRAMVSINKVYLVDYNKDEDDWIQEAILHLIYNRGDIEKNFKNNPDKHFYNSLKRYIMYKVITRNRMRVVSLNSKFKVKDSQEDLEEVISNSKDIEEIVLTKLEREKNKYRKNVKANSTQKCIEELKKQIESGVSREVALENTAQKLNLDKREMLDAMQRYLINNGRVKITKETAKLVDDEKIR